MKSSRQTLELRVKQTLLKLMQEHFFNSYSTKNQTIGIVMEGLRQASEEFKKRQKRDVYPW